MKRNYNQRPTRKIRLILTATNGNTKHEPKKKRNWKTLPHMKNMREPEQKTTKCGNVKLMMTCFRNSIFFGTHDARQK